MMHVFSASSDFWNEAVRDKNLIVDTSYSGMVKLCPKQFAVSGADRTARVYYPPEAMTPKWYDVSDIPFSSMWDDDR